MPQALTYLAQEQVSPLAKSASGTLITSLERLMMKDDYRSNHRAGRDIKQMSSLSVFPEVWMGAHLGGVEPLSHQQVPVQVQLRTEGAAVELGNLIFLQKLSPQEGLWETSGHS